MERNYIQIYRQGTAIIWDLYSNQEIHKQDNLDDPLLDECFRQNGYQIVTPRQLWIDKSGNTFSLTSEKVYSLNRSYSFLQVLQLARLIDVIAQ